MSRARKPNSRRPARPERAYLITWFEPSGEGENFYPYIATQAIVRSFSDASDWFNHVMQRQDSLNPFAGSVSLPVPMVFRISGTVRDLTDDEYDELASAKTRGKLHAFRAWLAQHDREPQNAA
jgi:hypothetical protein